MTQTAYCLHYIWCEDCITTRAFHTLEEAEAFVEHGLRLYSSEFEPVWLDERTYAQDEEGNSVMVRFLIEEYIMEDHNNG